MIQFQQCPSAAVFPFGMQRYNLDFERSGTPKLHVAQRVPKWHTAPRRRWLVPALRNQAIRHFRSVPNWHQNHDPKVATLCQIAVFFYDDVTSHSRAAGQPLFASAFARIRCTPARERGVGDFQTASLRGLPAASSSRTRSPLPISPGGPGFEMLRNLRLRGDSSTRERPCCLTRQPVCTRDTRPALAVPSDVGSSVPGAALPHSVRPRSRPRRRYRFPGFLSFYQS